MCIRDSTYIPSNTALRALVGGGSWNDGVHDGSRAVHAGIYPWYVNGDVGVWCVCCLLYTS